jgi:hypothetical protein
MARTKSQLKKLHRELWQWLADNPDQWKSGWPRWEEVGETMNNCFACEAAGEDKQYRFASDCRRCTVDWGYVNEKTKNIFKTPCTLARSPYLKWENARFMNDTESVTKYALLVRDAWK